MKKILSLLIIANLLAVIGCNDKSNKKEDTAPTVEKTNKTDTKPVDAGHSELSGCYMQVLSRDTFAASLQQQGNKITGKLSFDNYQKDGSTGTVTGRVENNIVKLLYSFASEGTNSIMEVYFKYDNGKLLKGTGDMESRGDTVYFKDPASIKYDGRTFQKLPCTSLPAKYK